MCLTIHDAELSKTILYAGTGTRGGVPVHVLAYQNQVKNLGKGPNCMALPFPCGEPMGAPNMVDVSDSKNFLKGLARSLNHPTVRSRGLDHDSLKTLSRGVAQVFNHGMYTVILANGDESIADALHRVPVNRRPTLPRDWDIDVFYKTYYPGCAVALCCFDAGAQMSPDPLLWWYVPSDPEYLFAPALDSHGGPPNIKGTVRVDHTVLFGGSDLVDRGGDSSYSLFKAIYPEGKPKAAEGLLPSYVYGKEVRQMGMPNGDFRFAVENLGDGPRLPPILRTNPYGETVGEIEPKFSGGPQKGTFDPAVGIFV
jgi:hypothetical protein